MEAMKQDTKTPFTVIKSDQTQAVQMNGKTWTQDAVETAGLTDEERALEEQEAALQQAREQINQKKEAALQQANAKLMDARDKAKSAASDFRQQAAQATDADEKKLLYSWATEADAEVRRLNRELGVNDAEQAPAAVAQPWLQRNRKLVAILQVLVIGLLIAYFHGLFNEFGQQITEDNQGLPIEKQLQPYDQTSIQKLVYEKLVIFLDLPIGLLMLFCIAPFIGFYVLPFVKSKVDFYTEFYEDLTPWQRVLISTILISVLLLSLAFSHNIKP